MVTFLDAHDLAYRTTTPWFTPFRPFHKHAQRNEINLFVTCWDFDVLNSVTNLPKELRSTKSWLPGFHRRSNLWKILVGPSPPKPV